MGLLTDSGTHFLPAKFIMVVIGWPQLRADSKVESRPPRSRVLHLVNVIRLSISYFRWDWSWRICFMRSNTSSLQFDRSSRIMIWNWVSEKRSSTVCEPI